MTSFYLRQYIAKGAVIIGCGLLGILFVTATASAQDDPTPATPPRGDCAECHLDIVSAWETSSHAHAYENSDFQEAWHQQNDKVDCLACHTTGFIPRTGEYEHEGVTCEACHGTTPDNHPPESVNVDPGVGVCEDCHTTTFTEWERSIHGEQQLACTTCHIPHPQQLRFDTAEGLCLNCHTEVQFDYVHVSHEEQTCTDCHLYRADLDVDGEHIMSGNLLPTGHDNAVETVACIACHAELVVENATDGMESSGHPILQSKIEIAELEAKVENLEAQGENTAAVRMVQGFVVGIAIGGILIMLWSRFRQQPLSPISDNEVEDKNE